MSLLLAVNADINFRVIIDPAPLSAVLRQIKNKLIAQIALYQIKTHLRFICFFVLLCRVGFDSVEFGFHSDALGHDTYHLG